MHSVAHRRLRDATTAAHRRLEARLDIETQVIAPAGRAALVGRFLRLHREVEAAAAPWLAGVAELDFEARRRTPRLEADLAELGAAAPAPAAVDDRGLPAVAGVGEALGLIYVMEGATLGGQVIRRRVLAAGQTMVGLGFLDPYGAAVGERWRGFLAVLEAHTRRAADVEGAVRGAVAGFRHCELRLCGAQADV